MRHSRDIRSTFARKLRRSVSTAARRPCDGWRYIGATSHATCGATVGDVERRIDDGAAEVPTYDPRRSVACATTWRCIGRPSSCSRASRGTRCAAPRSGKRRARICTSRSYLPSSVRGSETTTSLSTRSQIPPARCASGGYSPSVLIGRDVERRALSDVIAQAVASAGAAVVVRGEPGIGKTALLRDLVNQLGTVTTLTTAGIESECTLAFSALHRLLVPLLTNVDRLPEPQAQALGQAFGSRMTNVRVEDRFLIFLGALSGLDHPRIHSRQHTPHRVHRRCRVAPSAATGCPGRSGRGGCVSCMRRVCGCQLVLDHRVILRKSCLLVMAGSRWFQPSSRPGTGPLQPRLKTRNSPGSLLETRLLAASSRCEESSVADSLDPLAALMIDEENVEG